jgi:hypothetical protein
MLELNESIEEAVCTKCDIDQLTKLKSFRNIPLVEFLWAATKNHILFLGFPSKKKENL